LVQVALRHDVSAAGYVHAVALAAVHWPPQAVPAPPHAGRDPRGLPAGTWLHVPTVPATSHAMHCSEQGALQHTPSTQNPD
jgi:hypothetical protein